MAEGIKEARRYAYAAGLRIVPNVPDAEGTESARDCIINSNEYLMVPKLASASLRLPERGSLAPRGSRSHAKLQQQKSSEPTSHPTTKGLKEPQKVLASCADKRCLTEVCSLFALPQKKPGGVQPTGLPDCRVCLDTQGRQAPRGKISTLGLAESFKLVSATNWLAKHVR